MTSRHVIPGVLHNFLGTFTSRYSDYNGYWLFGFLVDDLDTKRINLLGESAKSTDSKAWAFAYQLAAQRFSEQVAIAGLSMACFREAYLDISKLPESRLSSGYEMRFQAHAVSDLGRAYERTTSISVRPHNPKLELRSARAGGADQE